MDSDANSRQVGGDHYKGTDYQHWDWVNDVRLHYLPATASKYVDRWRRHPKGAENLDKALHYIQKAQELGVTGSSANTRAASFWKFVLGRNHPLPDAAALYYIMEGNWQGATELIEGLLATTSVNRQSA